VARADYLEVRFGPAGWMKWVHVLISLLGILAVMLSPAAWTWKLLLASLLVCAFILILRNIGATRSSGVIRLFLDGTAVFTTRSERRLFCTLGNHHWVSRWFCSIGIYLARGGRKRFLLICAANNDPPEYRRLLKFLRMRTTTPEAQRMIW